MECVEKIIDVEKMRQEQIWPFSMASLIHFRMSVSVYHCNLKRAMKKQLRELLACLIKEPDSEESFNVPKAREVLTLNDPNKTAQILKTLWREKNDESKNFTKTQRDIFKSSIKQLAEEIAFVQGISLTEARKKIKRSLRKTEKK